MIRIVEQSPGLLSAMMCSICYIYEADTISDNNCGAGVYKEIETER